MTQPAKVQEPSMEEILASIRRIIADDEAKPTAAEKPAGPAAAKPEKPAAAPPAARPAMNDIPPSAIPAAQAGAAKVATPPLKPAPPVTPPAAAPEPAVPNGQDDIDALLSGLDEATSPSEIRPPLPDGDVFELTDAMALPDPPQPSFDKIEPKDCPPSNPPSTRLPIPCSATTHAPWKTSSRKCCGRCSNPGSTIICRDWWSASSRRKSSGFRADASAGRIPQKWIAVLRSGYAQVIKPGRLPGPPSAITSGFNS